MRLLACLLLFLAAPAVQAQMYKCVDERGKTRYSDKPIPDCKSGVTITAPPKPSDAKSAAPSAARKAPPTSAKLPPPPPGFKGPAPKTAVPTAPVRQTSNAPADYDKKYGQAQCRTLREEEAWLVNPRNAGVEARDARLAQVRQALAGCR